MTIGPLTEDAGIIRQAFRRTRELRDSLLKKFPEEAKELLFFKLDDIYASIIRQAGFVRFEEKAHRMMEEGKTIEEMSAVYLADLRKQLGPKVEVDELFAYEWAYIPHIFHTPFYCYAYSFGNLLTLALYKMYLDEGQTFVRKYIKLLSYGGSENPEKILQEVGIDIRKKEFWQKGFEIIKDLVAEFKRTGER